MRIKIIQAVVDATLQRCTDSGLTYAEVEEVILLLRQSLNDQRCILYEKAHFSTRDV